MSMEALRAAIRAETAAIAPWDALEAEHRQAALAWMDAGAELWRREKPATPPEHLCTYFALVDDAGLLLVDHKKAGLWLPTGGHVDPGEHPRDTVARELFEELGQRHCRARRFVHHAHRRRQPAPGRDAVVRAAGFARPAAAP